MDVIKVEGGHPISGEVHVGGAKNSALKLMAATIMAPGVTTLTNVPNISDVHVMGKVLKRLGATIDVVDEHTLVIDTTSVDKWETPYELVAKMRASTAVLGPLLARFGRAVVAMPGGCNIGARKIDLHILGLEALGVDFQVTHGNIHATAPNGIIGSSVTLEFASVGATENLMMASVHARGTTVIDNAAREPEIVDLANMLNEMGARIRGAGTPLIEIEAMGVGIEREEDGCTAWREGRLHSVDIQTLPFPGYPTDMQAQAMAMLSLADGQCIITENVFENRFMFAGEIARMGADIRIEGHHAIVRGVERLSGAQVKSPELRGGASLVLAGLVADGETTVSNIFHIERGYEHFVHKLEGLGAHVRRETIPDDESVE